MGIYGRKMWFVANNLGTLRESKILSKCFLKIFDFKDFIINQY